jgi:uncharacterized protein RhaS with RHS repeats
MNTITLRYIGMSCCVFIVSLLLLPAPGFAITYTYDVLNRLKTVSYENGGSITYSYDATGNITALAVVPDTTPPAVASRTPAINSTGSRRPPQLPLPSTRQSPRPAP